MRALIADSSQAHAAVGDEPFSSAPNPSGNGGPEAEPPISGLSRGIKETQATFVIDEGTPMLGKHENCVDTLAGAGRTLQSPNARRGPLGTTKSGSESLR